jgi:hypothetical protein
MDDDAIVPIPFVREHMAAPVGSEGSQESSWLARLYEDVSNLREALSVSRIREDSLFDRISTLEALCYHLGFYS